MLHDFHTVTYYLLLLLLVWNSSGDRDLACSISMLCLFSLAAKTTLHLCSAHPAGGFLMVGDGVFSIDGLAFGFSTISNPSSKSEALHQQYISHTSCKTHNVCPRIYCYLIVLPLLPCGVPLLYIQDPWAPEGDTWVLGLLAYLFLM